MHLGIVNLLWYKINFTAFFQFAVNRVDLRVFQLGYSTMNMILLNAYLSVETFFVLSGFLVSYTNCVRANKGHPFNLIHYYVNRYVRWAGKNHLKPDSWRAKQIFLPQVDSSISDAGLLFGHYVGQGGARSFNGHVHRRRREIMQGKLVGSPSLR